LPGNRILEELYPEFDEKVHEVRQRVRQMRITIKRAYWHDPTGYIEPTPITMTVGQHHLRFHRPVLGTEDMAIQALPYSNIDYTRKIIITDLLRRVNAAKMARMKANQIRLTRERDNLTPTPKTINMTPAPSNRRSPSPPPARTSPTPRRPNPPPDKTPRKKRAYKPRMKIPKPS
jgi:hypothetical protein